MGPSLDGLTGYNIQRLAVDPVNPAVLYYLLACADQELTVTELDEPNNCTPSGGTITVAP